MRSNKPTLAESRGIPTKTGPTAKFNADPPEQPAINTFDFAVTDYVVRLLLKNQMDINKFIEAFAPEATLAEKARIHEQVQTDVRIKTALQRDLSKLGLDDTSKSHYVEELWRWFHNEEDPRLRGVAARILGKAFIAEKVEHHAIEDLPIRGIDEGLKRMLGPANIEVSVEGDLEEKI